MKFLSSTAEYKLQICQDGGEAIVEKGATSTPQAPKAIEVHGPSGSDLKLSLTAIAGTGAGGPSGSKSDDGTDDDAKPVPTTDGDGSAGGSRTGGNLTGRGSHAVEIANSTGDELRLRIERTLPNGKALRIVGPPELFDVTEDDGGICVTLRSENPQGSRHAS